MASKETYAPPQTDKVPRHVAIIMDGNGRWARKRLMPRPAGHKAGADTVRRVVEACRRWGVEALTLFAFSSENWRRPAEEVGLLMDLFMTTLAREAESLHKNGIRLRIVGERQAFSDKLQKRMADSEALTAGNSGMVLNIAANYGGHWDIAQAARKLAEQVKAGHIDPQAIDADMLGREISMADLPEPDLFIRTGGERRISNFLLWQLAYTELYFTDTLWPDFSVDHMRAAVDDFGGRQRRFGKTGEQVEAEA